MNQDDRTLIMLSRDQPGKQFFAFWTRQVLTAEGQRETFRCGGFDKSGNTIDPMQDDWKEPDQCDANSGDDDGEIHWRNNKGIGIG